MSNIATVNIVATRLMGKVIAVTLGAFARNAPLTEFAQFAQEAVSEFVDASVRACAELTRNCMEPLDAPGLRGQITSVATLIDVDKLLSPDHSVNLVNMCEFLLVQVPTDRPMPTMERLTEIVSKRHHGEVLMVVAVEIDSYTRGYIYIPAQEMPKLQAMDFERLVKNI